MAKLSIEITVDSKGAITGIRRVGDEAGKLESNLNQSRKSGISLGRALEVAFGVAIQRLVANVISGLSRLSKEMVQLLDQIQDIDNQFSAVFRNMRDEADAFIAEYRRMTGFTTTESRRMASEIAGIALSLGETEQTALALTRQSALLALQWERISGMPIERGQQMITRALTGQVMQLQRAGILSRELTQTQFEALSMQQRLELVTEGLTKRYGNLDEATDGLTQKYRMMRGEFAELRDNLVREITPSVEKLVDNTIEWISNNEELIKVLGVLVSESLISMLELLLKITQSTDKASDSTQRLNGIVGKLIEAKLMWDRATIGLAIGIKKLVIAGLRLARTTAFLTGKTAEYTEEINRAERELRILNRRAYETQVAQTELRQSIIDEMNARKDNNETIDDSIKSLYNLSRAQGLTLTQQIELKKEELQSIRNKAELIGYTDNLSRRYRELTNDITRLTNAQRMLNLMLERTAEGIDVEIVQADRASERMLNWQKIINENHMLQLEQRGERIERIKDEERAMIDLSHTAQNAMIDMAASFGELLAGFDNVDDFGKRIKELAGDLLVNFGRTLVALGTMQLAIQAWNPAAMISAGVAAIAVGSAMKKRAQTDLGGGQGSSSAGGGGRAGITQSVQDLSGGRSVVDHKTAIEVTVQGELKGEDIVISGKRYETLSNRVGENE